MNNFNNNHSAVNTVTCKDCPRRHIGCHSHCVDYLAYKLEIATVKALKKKEKILELEAKHYDKIN